MTHTPLRILLLGMNGQVGWELQRSLSPLGELIALDHDGNPAHPGLVGSFTDLDGLARTVQTLRPDVIVNAAAHTAVDKAESEPALCRTLNAEAPAVLARCAVASGALLVHYSTDYVFDGLGDHARRETDPTGPLNVYGQTKLEGERAIIASGSRHLVFRTSWVFGARGGNFAKTMLRLAQERDRLTVIDDQIGAPTGADLLADVTAHAIRAARTQPALEGLYHLVAGGETSWHGYARFVLQQAQALGVALKASPDDVAAVPTSAFPTPAQRPLNSRLDTTQIQAALGLQLPHWQSGVARMLSEHLQRN
jgi:dTDP-4-dehydrorhamnose reductase